MASAPTVVSYRWTGRALLILEQRDLPHREHFLTCRRSSDVARAIREMSIRGAPAIGCAAAWGLVLASREKKFTTLSSLQKHLESARALLAATRPTAVNLFWALEQMAGVWRTTSASVTGTLHGLLQHAQQIHDADVASCLAMGQAGAALLDKKSVVLTHCNTGALATAGIGTALAVVKIAHRQGKIQRVYVDETRPYLQGARLTAWELVQEKIPHFLITDNMAGHILRTEKVDAILVGADRVAANGDTANKIGTYSLAVLARFHHVPFYVVAPWSTLDPRTPDGSRIPIEERAAKEVCEFRGERVAPRQTTARHPAFDVTPASLITAHITDRGVFRPDQLPLKGREFGKMTGR